MTSRSATSPAAAEPVDCSRRDLVRGVRRRAVHAAWPVGLREVDDASLHRRARAAGRGEIEVGGRTLFSLARKVEVPASERGLGMVFQSYAIWPHMDVFATRPSRCPCCRGAVGPRAARSGRVERALAVVRLDHAARRPATDLRAASSSG